MMRFRLSLLALVLALSGCSFLDSNADSSLDRGTVVYLDIEGGHFVLRTDDGATYVPVDLAAPFRRDGLRVRFSVRVLEDVVSICACGTVVEVVEIEAL